MEYETYGWRLGDSIAYFDGDDFTLEHDGDWWFYDTEIELLHAMAEIAAIHYWRFCRIEDLKRRRDEPDR